MKRSLVLLTLVLALVAVGCGSGTSSGPSDPAKLAPAGTLMYASFEIQPQGGEKQDFDAAFGKLLGADPEGQIAKGLTDAAKEAGSKLDYEQDVKPWLGDSVTGVMTGFASGKPNGALLVASTDDDKARAAIDKDLQGKNADSRSYRGADYKLFDGNTVNAVYGHFLVAGTEAAFKAIVDGDKDGKRLSDTDGWKNAVGNRGDGKVGLAFVDLKATIQSVLSGMPGLQGVVTPLALSAVPLHPFVATLAAHPDSLVLDISSPGTPSHKAGGAAASSALIETLPGDAWAAVALPHVGQSLQKVLAALKLNPIVAGQFSKIESAMRQATGLDLRRDVLAGIGDVGLFARGSSKDSLTGGLVIAAADRAALRRTLGKLPALIARSGDVKVRRRSGGFDLTGGGLPKPIEVRTAGPGAIAGYGRGSVRQTVAPASRLGASDVFRKAAGVLGGRPTLFVAAAPIVSLAEAEGHHDMSAQDRARLGHLEYLAVGARRDDGLDVIRAVLGIH